MCRYTEGKVLAVQKESKQTVVRDLTKTILNSRRNVRCDNFFSDIDLAVEPLEKNCSNVRNHKKKKREISSLFQPSRAVNYFQQTLTSAKHITL